MTTNRLSKYERSVSKLIGIMNEDDFDDAELFVKVYEVRDLIKSRITTANKIKENELFDEFAQDIIIVEQSGHATDIDLYEAFKHWHLLYVGRKIPKGVYLFNYINEKYGKKVGRGWNGISIRKNNPDDFNTL